MDSVTKGSFEGWNEVWAKENSNINPYFEQGKASTINSFWQQGYARDLLNLIKDKGYTKFCELGSGRGTTSMYLCDAGYTDITMVDLAEEGFEIAKVSFPHHQLKTPKLILSNVEKTSLESESFDCIYNIGLLEHFEDPSATLKEAYRLLKPGGLIFMPIMPSVPEFKDSHLRLLFNPISQIKLLAKRIIKGKISDNEENILRSDYNSEYYQNICQKQNYKDIICMYYNPYMLVNDKGFVLDRIVLPLYRTYYSLFRKKEKITFKSNKLFSFCLLLIASK